MFPEGTRIRPGSLGRPRRGVGRLALETGAPVVPVAVIGTEAVRRGWRIRPHKVRIRAGRALTFPKVEQPSAALAGAVTDRIWPCVELQWEWLGGLPRLHRAAVIGAGAWGTGLAVALARAGLEVDLGAASAEQAARIGRTGPNDAGRPGVALPDGINALPAARIELEHHDLVVLAVPAHALPAVVGAYGGRIPARAGVLVLARGLVPPADSLPTAYVAERVRARAVGCLAGPGADGALAAGAAIVAAAEDEPFLAQVAAVLRAAGLDVTTTGEVAAVQLAGTPASAEALAAAAAGMSAPTHRPGRSRAA